MRQTERENTIETEDRAAAVAELVFRNVSQELPGMKSVIDRLVTRAAAKLTELGTVNDTAQTRQLLTEYLQAFKQKYCAQVDNRRGGLDIKKLVASAFEGAENILVEELDIAAFSACGLHYLYNIPDDAIEYFAKRDVTRMKPIVTNCIKLMHGLMLDAIQHCTDPNMDSKYPMLNINITRVITNLINEYLEKCQLFLYRNMEVWTTFAHSSNANFLKKRQELVTDTNHSTSCATTAQTPTSDEGTTTNGNRAEQVNREELKDGKTKRDYVVELVRCYFEKVNEFIKIHVQNSITNEFVYAIVNNLDNALMRQLFEQGMIDTVMSESNVVAQDRIDTAAALEGFKRARDVIDNMI